MWIQASYDYTGTSAVGLFSAGVGGSYSSDHATRFSHDGGSDSTQTGTTYGLIIPDTNGGRAYANIFMINKADKEKLIICDATCVGSTGSGTAPQRTESVTKVANTSNQLNSFKFHDADGNNLNNGIMKVWGFD